MVAGSYQEDLWTKTKVAQLLYAEFGDEQFRSSQISDEAMALLVEEMGLTSSARPDLDSLVSKLLESLNGRAFRLQTGGPAYFDVHWSEKTHQAHSFQVIPLTSLGARIRVGCPTSWWGLNFRMPK